VEQQLMLVQAYLQANNVNNAINVYKEMIKALSKSPRRNNNIYFWLALVKNNLAKLYFSMNDISKAGNYSSQAVQALSSISIKKLLPEQLDEFYGSMAQCKGNLSLVCARLNKPGMSQKYIEEALGCLSKMQNKEQMDLELERTLIGLKEEKSTAARTSLFWVASKGPATQKEKKLSQLSIRG
jgi:tetratricopeptide (TPR) repeat protein